MAKLEWDKVGERLYETGVKKGVLYLQDDSGEYPKGVAWNGLTGVEENPTGADATDLYANDSKYLSLTAAEKFEATIKAYTYPDEWEKCDGSVDIATGVTIGQQNRATFGLVYVTTLGNDIKGNEYGYKIHIIYGAKAAPSSKSYATINDSPEAIEMSWSVTTTPVNVEGYKPTAYITVDSTKTPQAKLAQLEAKLFGDTSAEAQLPLPAEIATLIGTSEMASNTSAQSVNVK